MHRLGIASALRTSALTLAGLGLTAVAVLALTGPRPSPTAGLGGILEHIAWWALLVAGLWSTVVFGLVLRAQVTGSLGRLPCPRSWRPVIAALCGLGTATLLAVPAGASTPSLPTLGRPDGGPAPTSHEHPPSRITVRPGDSLWSIVVRRHPGEPDAVTARRVGRLHRANRTVIGPDADLIRPGQRLAADDVDPGSPR